MFMVCFLSVGPASRFARCPFVSPQGHRAFAGGPLRGRRLAKIHILPLIQSEHTHKVEQIGDKGPVEAVTPYVKRRSSVLLAPFPWLGK